MDSGVLCLSGGVDSATILAACLSIGRKPECVTFQLGEYPSADVKVATAMCRHFGLKQHIVVMPRDERILIDDIRRLVQLGCAVRKTHIQCAQPFLYIAAECKRRYGSEETVMIGIDADVIYGTDRRGAVIYHQQGDAAFRGYREAKIKAPNNSWFSIKTVFEKTGGGNLVTPYRESKIVAYLLGKTHPEMHKPFLKAIAVRSFPEFWRCGSWRRDQNPLQVVSGIRDHHDTLLQSGINQKNRKAIIGIYRDIANA